MMMGRKVIMLVKRVDVAGQNPLLLQSLSKFLIHACVSRLYSQNKREKRVLYDISSSNTRCFNLFFHSTLIPVHACVSPLLLNLELRAQLSCTWTNDLLVSFSLHLGSLSIFLDHIVASRGIQAGVL